MRTIKLNCSFDCRRDWEAACKCGRKSVHDLQEHSSDEFLWSLLVSSFPTMSLHRPTVSPPFVMPNCRCEKHTFLHPPERTQLWRGRCRTRSIIAERPKGVEQPCEGSPSHEDHFLPHWRVPRWLWNEAWHRLRDPWLPLEQLLLELETLSDLLIGFFVGSSRRSSICRIVLCLRLNGLVYMSVYSSRNSRLLFEQTLRASHAILKVLSDKLRLVHSSNDTWHSWHCDDGAISRASALSEHNAPDVSRSANGCVGIGRSAFIQAVPCSATFDSVARTYTSVSCTVRATDDSRGDIHVH